MIKNKKFNILIICIVLHSSNALSSEVTNKNLQVQIIPIGGIDTVYRQASTSGTAAVLSAPLILFGALGGLAHGLINSSQADASKATPTAADEIQNQKLVEMLKSNNSQIYFANKLASELSKCKIISIVSSSVAEESVSAKQIGLNLESVSRATQPSSNENNYVIEAGELTFAVLSRSAQDYLSGAGFARVYKLPSYELIKKYIGNDVNDFEYIRDFKESSIQNLGQLKEASELLMDSNSQYIAKQICRDKSKGLIN